MIGSTASTGGFSPARGGGRHALLFGLLAWLAAAACLALALAAGAGAAPLPKSSPLYNPGAPIVNENPNVTVDYQGTIKEKVVAPEVNGSQSSHFVTSTLEWDETVAGPVDQIEYTQIYGASSIHWHINKLTGTVKDDRTQGATTLGCTGTFSPTTTDAGTGGVFVPLDEPGHPASGGNPATNPDYSVTRLLPVGLVTSSAAGNEEYCNTNWWNGTGDGSWGFPVAFASQEPSVGVAWGQVINPTVYFPPGGSHTQTLPEFNYGCKGTSCGPGTGTGAVSIKVDSSITFTSPELPGAKGGKKKPPRNPPEPPCRGGRGPTCEDKAFAAFDLLERGEELDVGCALALLTLAEVSASVEHGTTSLAEAESVSAMLASASDFVCAAQIVTVLQDLKIVVDPPIGGLRVLAQPASPHIRAARLPTCRGGGAARKLCERLRSDELRYLAALRRGAAVDAALLTTVDRVTGALKARNSSAVKLQVRHASELRSQLRAARGLSRAARRAIAALLRSQHLGVTLTAAQQQRGIASALSKLHGVSQAQLEKATHIRPATGPTDVVAQLSR